MRRIRKTEILETRTARYLLDTYRVATLQWAVEYAANREREKYFNSLGDYSKIPVDVVSIARRKGIKITYEASNSKGADGCLTYSSGVFTVHLNKGKANFRANFTLAHEIGHTLFYRNGRHQVGALDDVELAAEENICHRFAGALLMPRDSLVRSFRAHRLETPGDLLLAIDRVARQFRVSLEALLVRLNMVPLTSGPAIALCLRYQNNIATGTDAQLRVSQCVRIGRGNRYQTFRNRSAEGFGLNSGILLFKAWKELLIGEREQTGGRYVLEPGGGCVRIHRDLVQSVNERVELTARLSGRWPKQAVGVEAASCLYAAKDWTARDAFIISVLMPNEKAPALGGPVIDNPSSWR